MRGAFGAVGGAAALACACCVFCLVMQHIVDLTIKINHYFCTSVLLYFCTSVLLYFCTSVLLYFCTSVIDSGSSRLGLYEIQISVIANLSTSLNRVCNRCIMMNGSILFCVLSRITSFSFRALHFFCNVNRS